MSPVLDAVQRKYRALFHEQPILFRAPGRINLIGEHTDYNDGFVMPAAIDKEISFAMGPASDGVTMIHSIDKGESVAVELGNVKRVGKPLWLNYLLGVLHRLKESGHEVKPFKCVFGGDIPIGAGLSSSAALECGFVYGLNHLHGFGLAPIDMAYIAQWAEHHFAGVKCGIMDQFSSIMGKKDKVFVLDCRSLEYTYFPLELRDYEIILLDSHVKHALAGSEYNVRRSECEEGVKMLADQFPGIKSLRDLTPAQVNTGKNVLPAKVYARCLYVTQENERVQEASRQLSAGDLAGFGQTMFQGHEGLQHLYEVSCPELDFLVAEVKGQDGVLGARMMGGGFGGCTINLVRSDVVNDLVEPLAEKYKKTFGLKLSSYRVSLCDGAGQINAKTILQD